MAELETVAKSLVSKGIVALDESPTTMDSRFRRHGIPETPENRQAFREALVTAEGVSNHISGVILHPETFGQSTRLRTPFPEVLTNQDLIPGVRVNFGYVELPNFPGNHVTEGLDGIRRRLDLYKKGGAGFTKWRAIFEIGEDTPSRVSIDANAQVMARYAAFSIEAGLVPIVEPEILMDGEHDIEKCAGKSIWIQDTVLDQMEYFNVKLKTAILKVNMVTPGSKSLKTASAEEIALATIDTIKKIDPVGIAGIVFLSGGQEPQLAIERLNAIVNENNTPYNLSFSFGRALTDDALTVWAGQNTREAQEIFLERARQASLARRGHYQGEA